MRIAPLASGSNGNCVYVETDSARILVDMGISFKEFSKRMCQIGRNPGAIDACFVTHEHHDHVAGVGVIARKLGIPVYINRKTYRNARDILGEVPVVRLLDEHPEISLGGTDITFFQKPHDAADPVSYIIEDQGRRFGVITDTGFACDKTKESVSTLHSLLLESNYDPGMLSSCRYPPCLKERIASAHGHLSNEESALLILEKASSEMKSVFLGHLSANSNTPQLAFDTFRSIVRHRKDLKGLQVTVASRHGCIGIYEV